MGSEVLGVLEFSSIAAGFKALDEMVKTAAVKIMDARTLCPGKYLVVFSGDVASVEYSYKSGLEAAAGYIVNQLFLPQIHPAVIPAIGQTVQTDRWDSIGIIETLSVVSGIEAADVAAKAGGVDIVEVRLAIGFGGKSYVKMIGSLDDVQTAVDAGSEAAKSRNQYCMQTIIPQPHSEIKPFFI